jgi:thioester reductase-like protein
MVPAAFVRLEALPQLPNGKLDRKALPAPDSEAMPRSVYEPPLGELEQKLAALWEQLLSVQRVGRNDDFFELGGSSVSAVRMLFRAQRDVATGLSLESLFRTPTLRGWIASISGMSASIEPSADELEAAAVLDDDIHPTANASSVGPVRSILLSGATGFLGAFILHELLLASRARVYCLVRAATEEDGAKRIERAMTGFGLSPSQCAERVVAVPGDLTLRRLGLSAESLDRLEREVDVICHNGAIVDFLKPYRALAAANVDGTQELLRLATRSRVKPVHYVSTLSVFNTEAHAAARTIYECDPLSAPVGLSTGYEQTKWVAERRVTSAATRGMPVSIYRAGRVTGHSVSGIWPLDFVARLLTGCIGLGCAPDYDDEIELMPVDYVARAVAHLIFHGRPGTYHLTAPTRRSWRELIGVVCSAGFSVELIDYRRWYERLQTSVRDGTSEQLTALLSLVPAPANDAVAAPRRRRLFEDSAARAVLRGSGISCPPPDDALIHRYLDYFVNLGVIARPAAP